jgi:cobalt/nickel transport system permease protein
MRPSPVWQGQVAGHMVGSLFLRSLERSERVHAAMLARGYNGQMPRLERRTLSAADWLTLVAVLLVLLALLAGVHRF